MRDVQAGGQISFSQSLKCCHTEIFLGYESYLIHPQSLEAARPTEASMVRFAVRLQSFAMSTEED